MPPTAPGWESTADPIGVEVYSFYGPSLTLSPQMADGPSI
jgi:hypothetical protein